MRLADLRLAHPVVTARHSRCDTQHRSAAAARHDALNQRVITHDTHLAHGNASFRATKRSACSEGLPVMIMGALVSRRMLAIMAKL